LAVHVGIAQELVVSVGLVEVIIRLFDEHDTGIVGVDKGIVLAELPNPHVLDELVVFPLRLPDLT
jgi:hypothetical protein